MKTEVTRGVCPGEKKEKKKKKTYACQISKPFITDPKTKTRRRSRTLCLSSGEKMVNSPYPYTRWKHIIKKMVNFYHSFPSVKMNEPVILALNVTSL
jgi:hypothetical protein